MKRASWHRAVERSTQPIKTAAATTARNRPHRPIQPYTPKATLSPKNTRAMLQQAIEHLLRQTWPSSLPDHPEENIAAWLAAGLAPAAFHGDDADIARDLGLRKPGGRPRDIGQINRIITLREDERLTFAAIGNRLGIDQSTAREQYRNARKGKKRG